MALLQISEPGQTAAPHQRKLAVGIDLGTTNSLVATVRSGQSATLSDASGNDMLPSVVHYGEQITVGTQAKQRASEDVANTIISAKRFLGRSLAELQQRYPSSPYHFQSDSNGSVYIDTRHGPVNPIQTSAEILKSLSERARETLGGDLDGVVITVPAYFDDAQRQGTKDAARLAGLNVLRLLNEPTAASIAYGLNSDDEGVIAVYDLGGGTFDISILKMSKGVFEVLSTGGDSQLGGDDFDQLLADRLAELLDLQGKQTASEHRRLHTLACDIKEQLSSQSQVAAEWTLEDGTVRQLSVSRAQFDALIQPLVNRTLLACRRALKDAGITADEVQNVVMVGGSTRVPLVRDKVGEYFGREPLTSIDPDKVVAIGAAVQADILVGNKPDTEMLLLDVIPLSLGIETMGGLVEKIIPRNTTIPVARAQEFTTFKDGQIAMLIHVLQGEREMVQDCRSLARFELHEIPPLAAGAAHIRVTFQVDADGLLSVTAMEKSTNVQSSITVKPSYGLNDNQVAEMLKSSLEHAQEDIGKRMLAEQRVEAERLLESLGVALAQDGDSLLNDAEKAQVKQGMAELKAARDGECAKQIEKAIQALDEVTQLFASRRMDASIRDALRGQSISDVE